MSSRARTTAALGILVLCVAVPVRSNAPQGVTTAPRDATPAPTGSARIRGRVVDAETGAALRNALLQLGGGTARLVGTDNDGRYELADLAPGRYTLSVSKPGYMTLAYGQRRPFESGRPIDLADRQTLDNVDFTVPRGGVIVARLLDENGQPVANVPVNAYRWRYTAAGRTLAEAASSYEWTDDRGEVRLYGLPPGDYFVGANPSQGAATIAAAGQTAYVKTFYPGTADVDAAQRVTVAISKEVGVSFPLLAARLGRITGVVRRIDGSLAGRAQVTVNARTSSAWFGGATVLPDGTFTVVDLPPGEYNVQAVFPPPGQSALQREMALVQASVVAGQSAAVTLGLGNGGAVRGRLVFEPERPSALRVQGILPYVSGNQYQAATTQADGTFVVTSVLTPGVMRLNDLPPDWFLKEIRLGGRDITDAPIDMSAGEVNGLEVVLTRQRAEVTGTARDVKGSAADDYAVVIFSEDRARWTATSRFIATARPDQQGRFRVGLLPGKYLAAALEYLETGSERDPEVLERLRAQAVAVTVADGGTQTVTLTLIR